MIKSVDSLVTDKEERHSTGSCVTADDRADAVDHHRGGKLREVHFDKIRHRACIVIAGRVDHKALAAVIGAVLSVCLHGFNDLLNDVLFASDLLSRNELTFIGNVHQRADIQDCSRNGSNGRHTTTALQVRKIGRKEPVVKIQLHFFDFVGNNVLMPIVALLTCLFVGYVLGPKVLIAEARLKKREAALFSVVIRYIAPVLIVLILVSSLLDALNIVSL